MADYAPIKETEPQQPQPQVIEKQAKTPRKEESGEESRHVRSNYFSEYRQIFDVKLRQQFTGKTSASCERA